MPDYVTGTAGASARREYERRSQRDQAKIRESWGNGRLGSLAVALTPEKQHTRSWSGGSSGEIEVGRVLDRIAGPGIRVLHDQKRPGSRANIDHLVVTASGVWVIDAKRYRDRRPERRTEGGLFRPLVEHLYVGGSLKDDLVDGMTRQMESVRGVVGDGTLVRGVLCFVDSDWSLWSDGFTIRGIEVTTPKRLALRIQKLAADHVDVATIEARLRSGFRSA